MLEGDKIDSKRDKNADVKGDPKPNTRRHGAGRFSCREARGNRKLQEVPIRPIGHMGLTCPINGS